ncbi:MAG: hypothetical protein BLITH_1029 [Brockia lithotrophica]|uniref:Uncharacterized protein n=1 Tax=Brockia lithotrophica TaxID=933949 RepID=A0A2T5G7B7_9BACL|nr:MAG: hypothetical protein BLITH_1029 [Brockia lithotrophica]
MPERCSSSHARRVRLPDRREPLRESGEEVIRPLRRTRALLIRKQCRPYPDPADAHPYSRPGTPWRRCRRSLHPAGRAGRTRPSSWGRTSVHYCR